MAKQQRQMSKYQQQRIMKRRKKRMKRIIFFLKTAVILAALYALVFHTPLFKINNIKPVGNSHVEDKQIIMAADIKQGQNILKINRRNAIKEIKRIPYIDDVKIKYKFYGKIEIQVKESENAVAVKSGKKFIYVDKNLKVLEIADKQGDLPVAEGFSVKKNKIGSKITIDESQKFDIILLYRKILIEKNIYKDTKKFLYDESGLTLVMKDGIKVVCGTSQDAEYKISAYLECRKAQPEITVGTFDVTTPSKIIYSID